MYDIYQQSVLGVKKCKVNNYRNFWHTYTYKNPIIRNFVLIFTIARTIINMC